MRSQIGAFRHGADSAGVEIGVGFEGSESGDLGDQIDHARILKRIDDLFEERVMFVHLCDDVLVFLDRAFQDHTIRRWKRVKDAFDQIGGEEIRCLARGDASRRPEFFAQPPGFRSQSGNDQVGDLGAVHHGGPLRPG